MTPRPRIAIATCAGYEGLKGDDELLAKALRTEGADAEMAVWEDEEVDWAGFDACLVRSTWDCNAGIGRAPALRPCRPR